MAITYAEALNEPLLGLEQEREAVRRWQEDGDRKALELLLRSHARQAYAQARRWTDNPVHLEDLVAEGMIGLMRAADLFDRAREVRFSTYAAWWVMTCISGAIGRVKTVIDIPARTYLDARMGRLDGPEGDLARMAMQDFVALEPRAGDEDGSATQIPSPDMTPEEMAAAASTTTALERLLRDALQGLTPQEREVITRRKLQPVPDRLEDLATEMGMTRSRLRQIEARALGRLRDRLIETGFSRTMLD